MIETVTKSQIINLFLFPFSVCHRKNGWCWGYKTGSGFYGHGKGIFYEILIETNVLIWIWIFLQKTDVTVELVEELQVKTKEFLQPNPTARAKMAAVKGISKLSGQAKSNTYPQPEGLLADCMLMYGKKLGENSIFGK